MQDAGNGKFPYSLGLVVYIMLFMNASIMPGKMTSVCT